MKKIGEYTMRGKFTEGEGNVIKIGTLFDGRFDTAYKITEVYLWASDWNTSTAPDCLAKLGTSENMTTTPDNFMDASNQIEIAWGGFSGSTDAAFNTQPTVVVDPDNLIVEDLYMAIRQSASGNVNYMIKLEKYDISDWQGALCMVRNQSQG